MRPSATVNAPISKLGVQSVICKRSVRLSLRSNYDVSSMAKSGCPFISIQSLVHVLTASRSIHTLYGEIGVLFQGV